MRLAHGPCTFALYYLALLAALPSAARAQCVEQPAGQVTWLRAEGDALDSGPAASHGTLGNGSDFATGRVGHAFRFDGVDDQITLRETSSLAQGGSDFTIEAWILPTACTGASGLCAIATRHNGEDGSWLFRLVNNGDTGNVPRLDFEIDSPHVRYYGASEVTLGNWHHVAVSRAGTSFTLYLDGQVDGSFVNDEVFTSAEPVRLSGQGNVGNERFTGLMDEVAFYQRALSGAEIAARFAAGAAGTCPLSCAALTAAPVARWSAEGNARDRAGSSDGALQNGAGFDFGVAWRAFRFDGVDDTVLVPDAPALDVADAFTLAAWVYPEGMSDGSAGIISKVGGAAGNNGYQLALSDLGGGHFLALCMFNAQSEAWASNLVTGGDLPAWRWSHLACSYDGMSLHLYLDGLEVGTAVVGAKTVVDSAAPLQLSGDANNHVYLRGAIDEAAVWNAALSADQILALAQARSAGDCRACQPPPGGLVSCWRGEGTAADAFGQNDAQEQGGAGYAAGRFGRAFDLDGVDDFVQVASPVELPLGNAPRTLALWFRTPRNLVASTEAALVQYGSTAGAAMSGLIFSGNAPGRLYFYGHGADASANTLIQPGVWYHGAVTYDGSQINLYVNGTGETATAMALNTVLDSNGLTIGLRPPDTRWQGQLDDVMVFDRALSADEIAAIADGAVCAGPLLEVSPTAIHYGDVDLGQASSPVELILRNQGFSALHISAVVVEGRGATSYQAAVGGGQPCAGTAPVLQPGESCTLQLTYAPAVNGLASAKLRIDSDDELRPQQRLALAGTGWSLLTVAVSPAGSGTVSGPGIDCGSDCSERSASASVELTAAPATGQRFVGWSGAVSSTDNPLTLDVTVDRSVTASFEPIPVDAGVLDAAQPDAAQPDAAQPDAAQPDAAQFDAAQPDAAQPDAAQPDAAQPDAARPDVARPDAARPDGTHPGDAAAGADSAAPIPDDGCGCRGHDRGANLFGLLMIAIVLLRRRR